MSISAHRTSTDESSLSDPSFDVVTDAVLSTVPQVAAVVGLEMWTLFDVPVAMAPKSHERTPAVIWQSAALVPPSIDQLTPASVGRVSVTVTPKAAPSPCLLYTSPSPRD